MIFISFSSVVEPEFYLYDPGEYALARFVGRIANRAILGLRRRFVSPPLGSVGLLAGSSSLACASCFYHIELDEVGPRRHSQVTARKS